MKSTILSFLILLGIIFCPPEALSFAKNPGREKSERISQGVYGTKTALAYSRVDIAEKLIDETSRIVTPPRKPLDIKPLTKTTTDKSGVKTTVKYVVLPAKMDGNIIKKDSPEFQELLKTKEILRAYQEGEKQWIKYSETVNEAMRQEQQKIVDLGKTIEQKEEVIIKKEKKIAELSKYRGIVFGVVGLIGLLIGIYILSLFIRLAIAGARAIS